MFRKNVAGQFIHFQGVDASTGGIKSGVTWTVRRCIDGTFAAGGGTVTEDGTTGWYKYAMSQADTNGNNIGFNFTGTGAVPQTVNIVTTAADPTDATAFGISRLDAAITSRMATFTLPTNFSSLVIDANGRVDLSKVLGAAINALVSGRMDSSVGAMGANVITAAAINAAALNGKGDWNIGKTGYALTTAEEDAIVNKVWDETTAEARVAGSYGQLLKDDIDTTISSRASAAALATVQADTDDIQTRLPAALVGGRMDSNAAVIGDKTGYALTAAYDPAKTASQAGDAMALTVAERAATADKLLGRTRAGGADGGRTVAECLAFGRNKWEIAAGVLTVYADDDTTPLYTAAVVTAAGDPVTSVDPT